MRYAILLLSFLINFNVTASEKANSVDKKQVAGVYKFKSTDPVDPGSQLILLEDQAYALATFFGLFTGTWALDDNIVTLSDTAAKNHYLYGRYTEGLGASVLFRFRGDDLRAATVNFDSTDASSRQTVFNSDANCFSQPFLYELNDPVNELELGYPNDGDYSSTSSMRFYNFVNTQGYNDFQVFVSDRKKDLDHISKLRVVENGFEIIDSYSSHHQAAELIVKSKAINDISAEQLTAVRLQIKSQQFPKELKFDHPYFPYLTREQEKDSKETASYFLIQEVSVSHDENVVRPKKHLLTSRCD